MIEFKKNGSPTVANKKCLRCKEGCKQHIDVVVLVCPNFVAKEK